ncbi:MAG: bifunctional DNA primase/polymerase, partial [Planctomycetia bacterium]|nr:bifunctional DNA primase/polymerase [Planctomycetia bacterium]
MSAQPGLLLESAHRYADLGYRVFPCAPGTKQPLTKNGVLDASSDIVQVEQWWTERPNANIGLSTDGLIAIDVESDDNPWLNADPERRLSMSIGPVSFTPGSGLHYVYRQPAGRAWHNTVKKLAPDVDTRANGGYIVLPPSVVEGGKSYRWAPSSELDVSPANLPEPPGWLVEQLDGLATGASTSPTGAASAATSNQIPSGQRNGTLARLAGTMRRVGMSQAEILVALAQANADRCVPPLEQREVERIAGSVSRYEPDQVSVAVAENHWEQIGRLGQVQFKAITSRELAEGKFELTYLIDGLLVKGQPGVIAGPKKTLKTNISIDLALSLGQENGSFLGCFRVAKPVRVGVMSGESGAATIQETARRIARAKNWGLPYFDNVVWSFEVPTLGNMAHTMALRQFITEYALDVLILDPTYLMMLGLRDDAANLFAVGELLKSLGDLAQETGCTPLMCHHLKKNVAEPYEPAELENLAWAGFQEFFRQWILLNRRRKYDPDSGGHHELWMTAGGSAGHSGLWGLNIDEGTRQDAQGRHWHVDVISGGQAFAERDDAEQEAVEARKQRQQESAKDRQREAVVKALRLFPQGETTRTIREAAGVSGTVFNEHMAALI